MRAAVTRLLARERQGNLAELWRSTSTAILGIAEARLWQIFVDLDLVLPKIARHVFSGHHPCSKKETAEESVARVPCSRKWIVMYFTH